MVGRFARKKKSSSTLGASKWINQVLIIKKCSKTKINHFIKETFLSETFFHFSMVPFEVFLITKSWFIHLDAPKYLVTFHFTNIASLQNRSDYGYPKSWFQVLVFQSGHSVLNIVPNAHPTAYRVNHPQPLLTYDTTWTSTWAAKDRNIIILLSTDRVSTRPPRRTAAVRSNITRRLRAGSCASQLEA